MFPIICPARHPDVSFPPQTGPARDPGLEEGHHRQRCGHHGPRRRLGVEPHRHLPQLRKFVVTATPTQPRFVKLYAFVAMPTPTPTSPM